MRIEEFIRKGYFWLPEQEEEKVPGTLTIKNGGDIELEVVGQIGGCLKGFRDDNDFDRIIGCVEIDGLVTLENCFYTERSGLFGGVTKSLLCVNRALCGAAYDKNENVTFNSLSFSVDCIDEWVGISGVTINDISDNKSVEILYTLPENISYILDGGVKLNICFGGKRPLTASVTGVKITQYAYFKLESDTLRPLGYFTNLAYEINSLMCFAIDTTVTLKNLFATSSELLRDIGGEDIPVPIKVYYSSIPFIEKVPAKRRHQMLFHFGAIREKAQDIFNKWINGYEVFPPALNLYFATQTDSHRYVDGKFLALVQGLETYHRRISSDKKMNTEAYDSLISTVVKECPSEHLKWLNGRLEHGNELNLSARLKLMVKPFKDYFGNSKEISKMRRGIVDTRNYLTHYNENLENHATDGVDIFALNQKMEVIFQLHFLKHLGFSDDEVRVIVENCYRLKQKIKSKVS